MPKKVAIIGAGPSGLVTAKTLLDTFQGKFTPVIFDSQHKVGGLWNESSSTTNGVNKPSFTLDPQMPTNLSRFTVAFSDLDWESVLSGELPIFPQASQVGRYLNFYAERFIPKEAFRLGCRVVATEREDRDGCVKWNVQWLHNSGSPNESRCSEDFDFLVVASGYFAQQYIPKIPGLENLGQGKVIHSSTLHQERGDSLQIPGSSNGKILVIGGSMSGVEAASAIALTQSSSMLSANEIPNNNNPKVHHIHSRPFWTLPTYLPHGAAETPSFQPLDLAMYDLSRRPPGAIEYALGPIPEDKVAKTNSFFQALLGSDYENYAHMAAPEQAQIQPPWVAIGNDYAEYVRSGLIQASMGRVFSVQSEKSGLASVQYTDSSGQAKTIANIEKIIMATGFEPFSSLSILPESVLSKLEYSSADPFSPLILDKGGTVRSEIQDIGFVGFYRGPYWGVMEMQARFLGSLWSKNKQFDYPLKQRESLRKLRVADPDTSRGQFPMGDYVGLMSYFAEDLGIPIQRSAKSGPVIPARYIWGGPGGLTPASSSECGKTMDALQKALLHDGELARRGAASAIFRALHGVWRTDEEKCLAFYPRYPTSLEYDREYVIVETRARTTGQKDLGKVKAIMRLAETGSGAATSLIEMWSVDLANGVSAGLNTGRWNLTPLRPEMDGDECIPGQYVISAKSVGFENNYCYTFHFKGVSISSWECVELEGLEGSIEDIAESMIEIDLARNHRSHTIYER